MRLANVGIHVEMSAKDQKKMFESEVILNILHRLRLHTQLHVDGDLQKIAVML